MNAILQALFTLVPFSTDLLNVTDALEADNSLSSANNQWSVVLMLMTIMTMMMMMMMFVVVNDGDAIGSN